MALSGGKPAKFAVFKEQFSALVLLNANSEQKCWVFAPTNHCHHPSVTGNENGEVASKSIGYHSPRKKGQGYQRR